MYCCFSRHRFCHHRSLRCSAPGQVQPLHMFWGQWSFKAPQEGLWLRRKQFFPFMFNSLRGDSLPRVIRANVSQNFTETMKSSQEPVMSQQWRTGLGKGWNQSLHGVFRTTPFFKNWCCITWISSMASSVLFQKELYLIRILNPQFFM